MPWGVDPATDCGFKWICATHVVSYVLAEGSVEEGYLPSSFIKTTVSKRHSSFSHVYAMLQRNIMQCLIPFQSRKISRVSLICCSTESIRQIQASYSPIFAICTLSSSIRGIVSQPSLFIYLLLQIFDSHSFPGPIKPSILLHFLIVIHLPKVRIKLIILISNCSLLFDQIRMIYLSILPMKLCVQKSTLHII